MEGFAEALCHRHKLRYLNVELQCGTFRGLSRTDREANVEQSLTGLKLERDLSAGAREQFCLEPLAALRGITNVEIRGDVERWFADALATVMRSPAGEEELTRAEYPTVTIQKRVPGRKSKMRVVRSKKEYWMPDFDWGRFRTATQEKSM